MMDRLSYNLNVRMAVTFVPQSHCETRRANAAKTRRNNVVHTHQKALKEFSSERT